MLGTMELATECVPCILRTRAAEVEALVRDPAVRRRCLAILLEEAARALKEGCATPPELSAPLFRRLKEFVCSADPYEKVKKEANRAALEIYRELREAMECAGEEERLELAIRASLAGNSIDVGVSDYRFPVADLRRELGRVELAVDDTRVLERVRGRLVVFLLDNCGEAVLDRLLAEELSRRGARVVAVVKSGAFQNDVTIYDSRDAGLGESFEEVVETGTDAASVFLSEVREDVLKLLERADLVVAKGMAHYEYLSEVGERLRTPILYMLRAKCEVVARSLSVPKGSYVAKLARAQK